MISFHKACEAMRHEGDLWDRKRDDRSDLDDQAMSVVLRGLEIRPDRTDGNTFWDDFIAVLGNNSEGAARLLGVGSDVVSRWTSKIKGAVRKAREENASDDERANMAQTGVNFKP